MGREKAASGHIALGEHNIVANYFEQNQAEALDLNLTVLDTLVQVGCVRGLLAFGEKLACCLACNLSQP
jgi:hypothetical protein